MTKLELIKELTEAGVFELTQEILDIIGADETEAHASANKDLNDLIGTIHSMTNWTLFSWRTMLDLVSQAYGFEKYAAYSNLDTCADIEDQLDELHDILWSRFSHVMEG